MPIFFSLSEKFLRWRKARKFTLLHCFIENNNLNLKEKIFLPKEWKKYIVLIAHTKDTLPSISSMVNFRHQAKVDSEEIHEGTQKPVITYDCSPYLGYECCARNENAMKIYLLNELITSVDTNNIFILVNIYSFRWNIFSWLWQTQNYQQLCNNCVFFKMKVP